ncbi:hypothetical protein K505DRAFT_249527 [Melanomma pulvis-pyrius CBS 109.77]|uniref:Uncharacterized protein n=1 Tax=Melanomma pulvis-pyrius CBS 109.77 TaxID=1314802 RepID=A0A6A6X4B2_9PLEO|nr:hypothetical protein K505DRAFT_249527 [Melanomma pulvis-pyrius CBS 109.77]
MWTTPWCLSWIGIHCGILKPYELKFDLPPGLPKSNAVPRKNEGIVVEDIRGGEEEFSIEKNSFVIMNLDAHVTVQDFVRCDGEEPAKQYSKPLAESLKSFLLSRPVRKSHPDFHISKREKYKFSQPATLLHVGTVKGT